MNVREDVAMLIQEPRKMDKEIEGRTLIDTPAVVYSSGLEDRRFVVLIN